MDEELKACLDELKGDMLDLKRELSVFLQWYRTTEAR